MPFSQIIPPSPSPSESKSLLYTSVSFFLSCIQGRHCHLPKFHIDSILKSKDITLQTKIHIVKAMVFSVIMYGFKIWTIKKTQHQWIDAFELWCWRRLLKGPWAARRSNQSILKRSDLSVHWKEWCWRGSSNTLATWCKELTQWKRP